MPRKGGAPENLKPFRKGNDPRRNLKGRPQLPDIKEALAKILEGDEDGMTALEEILRALIKKAKKGDVRAAQELLDRAYGKSKLSMDHTTGGEKINIPMIHWVGGNGKQENGEIKDLKVRNIANN